MAAYNSGSIVQSMSGTKITWQHDWAITYLPDTKKFRLDTKLYIVIPDSMGAVNLKLEGSKLNVHVDFKRQSGLMYNWDLGEYDFKKTVFYNNNPAIGSSPGYIDKRFTPGKTLIATCSEESPYSFDTIQGWQSFARPFYLKYDTDINLLIKQGEYSYLKCPVVAGPTSVTFGVPQDLLTTIMASDTYFGKTTTISLTKKSNYFKNQVTYDMGEAHGIIAHDADLSTFVWTVPEDLISYLPITDTSGLMTITCSTYDRDGYLVGDPQGSTIHVMISNDTDKIRVSASVEDTNPTTLALTGDKNILVKYFSNAKATVLAVPLTGTTIKSQTITNSKNVVNGATATFNNVDTPLFTYEISDSRGYVDISSYTAPFVEYSKLTCNIFGSIIAVSGKTAVTIEGNYFNSSFGAVDNTLSVLYRYKVYGTEWPADGGWRQINPNPTEYNYRKELEINGLDYTKNYVIQAIAYDKLMTVTSTELTVSGRPIFDWGKEDFHIGVQLNLDKALNMGEDQSITGVTADGTVIAALTPINSSGDTVLGYGNYTNESGDTYIYGDNVNLIANNAITVNGRTLGGNVLWSGSSQMISSHTITLKENISSQISGLVLVFSAASGDVSVNSFFISKKEVEAMDGAPHSFFLLNNSGLATVGAKYLYISNGSIKGHDTNSSTGTAASGITFTNNNFVLRYVIGV
jgi:hypothetical protein